MRGEKRQFDETGEINTPLSHGNRAATLTAPAENDRQKAYTLPHPVRTVTPNKAGGALDLVSF